jgi:predicted pyridoxine 5'-phosphate oxidase superfamily flavin-nucleotide-binding protein
MAHAFAQTLFTPQVREVQQRLGSRDAYARHDAGPDHHAELGPDEALFIEARDSFYMATTGQTGWPYVQHRGGPAGFVRVLDPKTLALPDFRGNRQYISVGNLETDDRAALFFMDYANRARLKLIGHVAATLDPAVLQRLALPDYRARVERALVIRVVAFDWNCPQHITPRFTEAEIAAGVAPLRARLAELEAENAALKKALALAPA